MQWYGGLGIVVLSVALLMGHHAAARRLADPIESGEMLVATARTHAQHSLVVYLWLTLLGLALVWPLAGDGFTALVHVLASHEAEPLAAAALRAFELLLLRETGHLPALDAQTLTFAPLSDDERYRLVAEGGLRAAHADDSAWLHGAHWRALTAALADEAPLSATLNTVAELPGDARAQLRQQLRELLHYHCGVGTLRTRQLLMDIQALS